VGWAGHYRTQLRAAAIAFDVVVAVLGAVLVGWIVGPLVGLPPGFAVFAFFASAFGAAAVLFCVHVVRQTVAR
jgi:uncharacterized membrane protein YeaQ/YmgE (transglycosylase-associated protein family)